MAITLRSMRLERGLTQREVAERMGVQRPAVSKMERKADISIGRFTELVEAMDGRWQISVWFADGREYSAGHRAQPGRLRRSRPFIEPTVSLSCR